MALDRGVLTRVDRRLFAEIDDNPAGQNLDDQTEALRRRQRALRERERTLHRLSGPNTRASVSVSVGRNEACPCGSGLKYKRCHGRPE
ncbi:MAG: SEC-C metal-binding domain-containing protein [Actinomycetota bacterium]